MNTPTVVPGGLLLEVTLLDGTTQKVNVREFPIRQLATLDELQNDEPALVEAYCNQETGWADTLTHESYARIVEAGDGLNGPAFADYWARTMQRLKGKKNNLTALKEVGLTPADSPNSKRGEPTITLARAATAPEAPAAAPAPAEAAVSTPA